MTPTQKEILEIIQKNDKKGIRTTRVLIQNITGLAHKVYTLSCLRALLDAGLIERYRQMYYRIKTVDDRNELQ